MMKLVESRLFKTIWGQRLVFSLLGCSALYLLLLLIMPSRLSPVVVLIIAMSPAVPILIRAHRAEKKQKLLRSLSQK